MSRNKVLVVALVILLSALLTACQLPFLKEKPKPPNSLEEEVNLEYPVTVGEYEILYKPIRVVSLSAAVTEKMYDLNMEESLVGVSDYTQYPSEAMELENCGTALLPDIELIKSISADLVISSTKLADDILEELEAFDILAVEIAPAENLDGVWQNYSDIGAILEGEVTGREKADALTGTIKSWFDDLKSSTSSLDSMNILYLRKLNYVVATGDTLEGKIFKELGLNSIADEYSGWLYPAENAESPEGKEAFKSIDMLFIDGKDVTIKMLEKSDIYKGLSATLEDNYIIINPEAMERQSMSMFMEIESLVEQCWGIEATDIGVEHRRDNEELDTGEEASDDEDVIDS